MITNINEKDYNININNGFLEVQFMNEETGLQKVYVFQDLSIGMPSSKRVDTIYYSYDITPTGQRINQQRHSYQSSEQDYNDFEASTLGFILKRSIVNGLFRFILQNAERVFDDQGNLIVTES
jgi:hypothetical protein